ncbi:MAG: TRAP transporter large permease [Desulfobacteraceae bacterium]|nr:MAG: TRAP transporter large permease [Desulfobacteraceae bacterium]
MGILPLVVLLCSFLAFALLGLPVFISMGLASVVYCTIFWSTSSFTTIAAEMVEFLNNFAFLCVPFFILAGDLMNAGGITRRLVGFSTAIMGHIQGGLSHVNIAASMIFSGVSGSAVADTSAIGSVLIPAMKEDGYPAAYAAAVTAASSTIGPIIPPSIPLVIYGLINEQSIGRLFLAGAIPGTMLGLYLLVVSYLISKRRNYPARPRASFRQILKSTVDAAFALVMPLIIIGGIVSGIVTPTEAGVLAVAYALVIGLFVYRELSFTHLPHLFCRSIIYSSYILAIIATAGIFSYLVAEMRAGEVLLNFFTSVSQSKWVILCILNIFFLIWGCILEPMTALVVVVPMLMPLVKAVGIDPIHFGVVVVLNLMIALFTPPVGIGLYLATTLSGERFNLVVRETPPFLLALVLALISVTFVPELSLWLPRVFMGQQG